MTLPVSLRVVNEGLAFLLELLALGALAWWGWQSTGEIWRILPAVAAPASAALLWGMFAAPRARFKVSAPTVLVVKAVVFGSATASLWVVRGQVWAVTFAVVVLANTALLTMDRSATARRLGQPPLPDGEFGGHRT
ncbi:YrdB family protein [Streptomyces sp. 142MFCol3.1]|uniref:YrdB family protein n=1 Tax=Streptomyces sp. 142MFCol3.1 TaxID=1172179 RepID=UPI000407C4B7|nr:YrdB family protein [Streptomyces sp. 142MFCol3.1]